VTGRGEGWRPGPLRLRFGFGYEDHLPT